MKKLNFRKFPVDKKTMKKIFPFFVLIVVLSVCIGVGMHFFSRKTPEKKDTGLVVSTELTKDKKFLDLSIQDIEIEEGENIVHLMANIYNHGEAFSDRMVDIVFLDQDKKEIGRVATYISAIEKDGSIRIDTVIDRKYAKAYTFDVEG